MKGRWKRQLKQQISKTKYAGNLQLLGHCQDVIPLFEAMDMFVLSSLREGLPNVVLEAMAMGVPVVATQVAGIPSLIEDHRHGLLVPPDDVAKLAQTMQQMIINPERRDQLSQAARSRIELEYSFERRMQEIAIIYDQLLENTKS